MADGKGWRLAGIAALLLAIGCQADRGARSAGTKAYAGSGACRDCHHAEHDAWADSLHAHAMKAADAPAVQSPLPSDAIAWHGGAARLGRDGAETAVVLGAPGAPRHPVPYVLGHRSLEQPLAALPGGRLQALPFAYDPRRREWFDLFPGDPREPGDFGHWTGQGNTANSQCLSCHTTGYVKGYDVEADAYATRWAELGVGCEACHGPRQAHVAQRRAAAADAPTPLDAARTLDGCATCHALRRDRWDGFQPGADFLDHFEPILLDGDEYHPDGQLRLETYEWGSFLQSAMHRAGVTCLACHDVHSTRLRAEGNALCFGCHDTALAAPAHTRHAAGTPGSQCVDCHMPATVFMQRDPRRDHSFPLPDPDATAALGVPNACTTCHTGEDAAWAARHVRRWYGDGPRRATRRARATAVAQARRGDPAAVPALLACVTDCEAPIWQASAARLLAAFPEAPGVEAALTAAAAAPDALTRSAAVWALAERATPSPAVERALLAAARDPVRGVRLNAAWGLRTRPAPTLPAPDLLAEWETSMAVLAEHPETQHTLGVFHGDRGDLTRAEAAYRRALRTAPDSIPPRYNLAMLLAAAGDAHGAEAEFRRLRALDPAFAPAACGLGAIAGDAGRWEEAARALQECLRLDPTFPGALPDLAHAYEAMGLAGVTDTVLRAALDHPGARPDAYRALVAVALARGEPEAAAHWAREGAAREPALAADAALRALAGP